MMDTIIALSSGAVPSGIAVVRVSGPQTDSIVERLAGICPEPRHAVLRLLKSADGVVIDQGLVVRFPGPASFTGEDCAEFQVHGGRAVVDALLSAATSMTGVRLAEAGEFAQRAFINGKLDLTEAEGLADLIDAETDAQRRFALSQARGGQRALYEGWRDELLHARAMVEADIDFTDEEDVPGSVADKVWADVAQLRSRMEAHIAQAHRGEIRRNGFSIVLLGRPNTGKSTLLNCLARSDRAIVSDEPGTTRDVIDVRLDMGGYLVTVADTAGLRDGAGQIEAEGMRRARQRAEDADLVLHLDDDGHFDGRLAPDDIPVWRITTKIDRSMPDLSEMATADFAISAVTGTGLEELEQALIREVRNRAGAADDSVPSQMRHVGHLRRACAALRDAESADMPIEMRAERLRIAAVELGRITGAIDVEDVLGAIFSRFCIGK